MNELKLTPMRLLALKICVDGAKKITMKQLSHAWLESRGSYRRVSSRRNFGNNSTAIKRLNELKSAGYLKAIDSWGETFSITDAGREAYAKQIKNGN